jgi:uncharacterized protein with ParB-like and HNH nuclease domain
MPREINHLTIELDGIGHTLTDRRLAVPIYQRSYAWEEKHVIDLYDDLLSALRNSEDEYFIGSVVISAGTGRDEVVDGQQRLATIAILISAIRDHFASIEDEERAADIQNQYLSKRDRRSQEVVPNLKLNINDNDYFYKKIILFNENSVDTTRASHERIEKAYRIARNKISAFVSTESNPANALLDICDFIDNHLKIIVVLVPDHANAFTIFETLNDRGLDLAISDLLKNYLLGQSDNRLEEVQENWAKMYTLLEATDNESLVVTFIRHYWSSIFGLTRERELYSKIKQRITSKQRSVDLSIELERAARVYVALIDTSQSYWNDYSIEAKNHMATLNLFKMTQMRPLLLAIMDKFSTIEVERSLKFLVAVSSRFLITGGLGGGALEAQFSDRAREISDGTITTKNGLKDAMSRAIPSDTAFKEAFKTASVSKQYLARYYLMTLEKSANGEDNPELIPNGDTSAVNLEHILPKTYTTDWDFNPDQHKAYSKRLGNLAIMSTRLNSEVGNSSFEIKKPFYEASDFSLTKSIADADDWTELEINTRQEMMAELAVNTWRI